MDEQAENSWKEKQDFMIRFIAELGAFIEHKASEFEIPPVIVIGALEILKAEWLGTMTLISDVEMDADDASQEDENNDPQ